MRLIVIFIIVIFIISLFVTLGQFATGSNGDIKGLFSSQSKGEQVLSESSGLATIGKAATSLINTFITKGPKEGEAVEGNTVTFEFDAVIPSGENKEVLFFETKVEGIDDDWKKTNSQSRTIYLPPTSQEYTFQVRAVGNPTTDPTPATRTFKSSISPYRGKVEISNVSRPYDSKPSVITLSTRLQEGEEINITGWEIQGKRGKTTIPQGIEKYYPERKPKDIIIGKGSRIQLSSGQGPLGKKTSFRLNKCLGYLARSNNYSLNLSNSCPRPTREEVSHLKPCCQEFILRIRGCEVPDYTWNYKVSQDSECRSYLEKNFNYNGCFRNYAGDEDFLWNNWYVFLSFDIATGDYCDTIYLRDRNGLLVDEYSYGRDVCR